LRAVQPGAKQAVRVRGEANLKLKIGPLAARVLGRLEKDGAMGAGLVSYL